MSDKLRLMVIAGVWALELTNIIVNMVIRGQPTDPAINLVFTTVIGAIITDRAIHNKRNGNEQEPS